jgi:glycerol-3-phosphate acyltransferase PlsX
MVRYDLLTKINQTLNRHGDTLASASAVQEAIS